MKRCGTVYMYELGCRCTECLAASRDKARRHRAKLTRGVTRRMRRHGPIPIAHGIASSYGNHGCRCLLCRAAWREYRQVKSSRGRREAA